MIDPDAWYLDTSIVTTALYDNFEFHDAARGFCGSLVRDHHPVCFSELLRLEYAHSLRRIVGTLDPGSLRSLGLHRWERAHVRRRWIDAGFDRFERFIAQFALAQEIALTRETIDYATELMVFHNLDSYDAAHIATALSVGASHIVALDRHYGRVRNIIDVHIIPDDDI